MRRWAVAAGVAVLAVGGGALALQGGGDDPPRGGVLGATASRPPADVAAAKLRIGPTSRFDLSRGSPLPVRAPGPGTVRVTVTGASGTAVALGSAPLGGKGTARLRVAAPAAKALGGCAPARVTVTVRGRGGLVTARRTQALPAQPPVCGRFFGPGAVWNQRADRAPLDEWSGRLVKLLSDQVEQGFAANFAPTINWGNYSAPVYTVPAGQPRVPVTLVGSRTSYGQALAAQLAQGVPIPQGARAAWGSDHHLVIWQPATDTMWELWQADDSAGKWTAQWGGRMDGVSRSPGFFSDPSGIQPGATATSLPLVGGLITRADLARGDINHALAMAIPSSAYAAWSYPAQRSDGGTKEFAIPAGARFRLDPKFDVDALDAPPFTKLLARAAQRYGIYVRDTSPTVVLYAEDPAAIGSDPWKAAITPSPAEVLRAFPWDHLQVTKMDLYTYSGQRVKR